jgi:hypothetical protein
MKSSKIIAPVKNTSGPNNTVLTLKKSMMNTSRAIAVHIAHKNVYIIYENMQILQSTL